MHGHSINVNTYHNFVHGTLPGHGFEADLLSDHELFLVAPVMADPGVRLIPKYNVTVHTLYFDSFVSSKSINLLCHNCSYTTLQKLIV